MELIDVISKAVLLGKSLEEIDSRGLELRDVTRIAQIITDEPKQNDMDLKKAREELRKTLEHRDHVKERIIQINKEISEVEEKHLKRLEKIEQQIRDKQNQLYHLNKEKQVALKSNNELSDLINTRLTDLRDQFDRFTNVFNRLHTLDLYFNVYSVQHINDSAKFTFHINIESKDGKSFHYQNESYSALVDQIENNFDSIKDHFFPQENYNWSEIDLVPEL